MARQFDFEEVSIGWGWFFAGCFATWSASVGGSAIIQYCFLIGIVASLAFLIVIDRRQKKSIKYLKNTPPAEFATLDSYVKVHGTLTVSETTMTPCTKVECAGFTYQVMGGRTVKAKKPDKGSKTVENKVYQESSVTPIVIGSAKATVTFDLGDLFKSAKVLVDKTHTSVWPESPVAIPPDKQKPYEYFRVIERALQRGDEITVFGRLDEDNGQLVLKPPGMIGYPFIFLQGSPERLIKILKKKNTEGVRVSILWRLFYLLWAVGLVVFSLLYR